METRGAPFDRGGERWLLTAGLTCCLALVLGVAALLAAGSAIGLRGGLGLAGIVLLGTGVGLLPAHLVLDERRSAKPRGRK